MNCFARSRNDEDQRQEKGKKRSRESEKKTWNSIPRLCECRSSGAEEEKIIKNPAKRYRWGGKRSAWARSQLGKVRWRVENPHMKFITFLYMSINVYYNSPVPSAQATVLFRFTFLLFVIFLFFSSSSSPFSRFFVCFKML